MLMAALLILATGCADHVNLVFDAPVKLVGFWHGCWHGSIMFIAFIWSLFDPSVTIYAVYNNGAWYNFGFVLGFGGLVRLTHSII